MIQYLPASIRRWIPPPLPTQKGPEHEKEAGTTYAAGKSRVCSSDLR